jgi:hypothetical protein
MLKMGFPPDATGPWVTELRAHIRDQVAAGMVNRSGGTWNTEENPDIWNQHELRARCLLEVDWSIGLGHSHRVELLDTAPIMRSYDLRTMRRRIEFRPQLIWPWIADRLRSLACDYRIWRDRNVKNPYSK